MTRRRPGTPARPASTTPIATDHDTAADDLDRAIVGEESLWAALFDGRFRLALRCDVCGRWLTSGKSKANGRGPSCAARAVKQ